jgi:hypothetical protein
MSALATLLKKLAANNGVDISDDDLAEIGLNTDEEQVEADELDELLSQELPGRAAGRVELFFSQEMFGDATPAIESPEGLMYYPIIRSGQWAVRPGNTGKKRRVPLKVIPGKSKNSRREIGLQDLHDNFHDGAIQHVTVPASHANTSLENQGYIDDMKLVDGEVKNGKTKKMEKVKVLLGGYRITEPDTKAKLKRGSIANRSAGILYDYVNTETGKQYNSVVEHVALTNKPWITGMISFGRPLSEAKIDTVGLSLSDEGPDTHEYALILSDEAEAVEAGEGDFLAEESTGWSKEDSPTWLRQQVNQILNDARAKKVKAKATVGAAVGYDYDYPPRYRCVEARPGTALISDDWGDDANHWTAPISVKDGAVSLSAFSEWKAVVKAFIPDERPAPPADKLPLSQSGKGEPAPKRTKTRLELAQEARRVRSASPADDNTTPREVVEQMAGSATEHLSEDELRRRLAEAEEARRQAEERETRLSERLDRVTNTVNTTSVRERIALLKKDPSEGGLGLSEERGFGGALAVLSEILLADDGEPAVQSDLFADETNKTGELTLSEAFDRFFDALHKAQEGKAALGETLSESADPEPGGEGEKKGGESGQENGIQASETPAGKPGAGDPDGEQLSTDERKNKILSESPGLASLVGRPLGDVTPQAGEK